MSYDTFDKFHPPTGIEALVCEDISKRQQKGIAKYGVTVAENPLSTKDWMQHAYEECLDQAVYLKKAIVSMDGQLFQDSPVTPSKC